MRARGGTSRRPPHYRCRFPILPLAGRRFNPEQGTRIGDRRSRLTAVEWPSADGWPPRPDALVTQKVACVVETR